MSRSWAQWEGRIVDGKFPLRRYLGGSDHSAVFLTERENGRAAIKLVPAGDGDARLACWRRAAALSHPHLLRLFEMGQAAVQDTSIVYLVMQYADEDLSQVLPHRALTREEVDDMLPAVLDALTWLHGQGLVHQRLRPSNIMAANEELRLSTDSVFAIGEAATHSDSSIYRPPESGLSPASDVWCLGVTLVEVLTRLLPAWDDKDRSAPVLPQGIPEPFREIAGHCLRANPEERWGLGQIFSQIETAPATPAGVAENPPPPPAASRRKLVLIASAVVLAAAVLLAWPRHHQKSPQQTGTAAKQPARPSAPPAAAPVPAQPKTDTAARRTEPPPVSQAAPAKKPSAITAPADPDVLQRVVPDVPVRARETIRGRVKVGVRVAVDPAGNVNDASLDSPGPSKYFDRLALQAAQGWKFVPSASSSPREWLLRFEFERSGTRVVPSPAHP